MLFGYPCDRHLCGELCGHYGSWPRLLEEYRRQPKFHFDMDAVRFFAPPQGDCTRSRFRCEVRGTWGEVGPLTHYLVAVLVPVLLIFPQVCYELRDPNKRFEQFTIRVGVRFNPMLAEQSKIREIVSASLCLPLPLLLYAALSVLPEHLKSAGS